MSEELDEASKTKLAQALAQGISAERWAKSRNVPRDTAYRWARDPAVRREVAAIRRHTIDLAAGLMTRHTKRAAEGIVKLADCAESESVRLSAARVVFSRMITVSKGPALEERISEIESRLDERDGAAGS